jgi:hypothetical protein
MALSSCRECGKRISTEAASCPHCGVPTPSAPTKKKPIAVRRLLYALGVLLALWFFGWLAAEKAVAPKLPDSRRQLAAPAAGALSEAPLTVTYEVRSDYVLASVTYSTPDGIAQDGAPRSARHDDSDGRYAVWRGPTMTVRPGTFLSVSGQLDGGGDMADGSVTYIECRILVGGRPVVKVRSQGKYAVASCSGQA